MNHARRGSAANFAAPRTDPCGRPSCSDAGLFRPSAAQTGERGAAYLPTILRKSASAEGRWASMKPRMRVQPSTAIATLALFLALGGTSYAVSGGTPYRSRRSTGRRSRITPSRASSSSRTDHGEDLDFTGFPQVPPPTRPSRRPARAPRRARPPPRAPTPRRRRERSPGRSTRARSPARSRAAQTAQSAHDPLRPRIRPSARDRHDDHGHDQREPDLRHGGRGSFALDFKLTHHPPSEMTAPKPA